MVTVQVQGTPTGEAPATLFILVTVRSEPRTVTVSAHALLPSLSSATLLFGSTRQVVPARGLANTPSVDATEDKATRNPLPAGIETVPPLATQVNLKVKSTSQVNGPV